MIVHKSLSLPAASGDRWFTSFTSSNYSCLQLGSKVLVRWNVKQKSTMPVLSVLVCSRRTMAPSLVSPDWWRKGVTIVHISPSPCVLDARDNLKKQLLKTLASFIAPVWRNGVWKRSWKVRMNYYGGSKQSKGSFATAVIWFVCFTKSQLELWVAGLD